ncbi:hypothetical protein KC19_1G271800 [Ceratodon purpureus]|uniref:Uncharacterized protein n=1 Tax=Ceratodon purpureus TaxID=3225 RepID=A0A8T0J9T7_CERPU|nr:hypothetical protein KC19_1G271800 [Ceratodon purpureus]
MGCKCTFYYKSYKDYEKDCRFKPMDYLMQYSKHVEYNIQFLMVHIDVRK